MSFALTGEEHKPDNFNGGDDDKDGCGLFALLLFVVPMAAAFIAGALAVTGKGGGKIIVTNDRDTGKIFALRGGEVKEVGKGEAAALFTSKGHWEGGRWVVDEVEQCPY